MDAHADVAAIEPFAVVRALARRWKPTRRLATSIECRAAGRVLDRHRPVLVWCNTVLSANYVKQRNAAGSPSYCTPTKPTSMLLGCWVVTALWTPAQRASEA